MQLTTEPAVPPRVSTIWWLIIIGAWIVGIQLWLLTDFWLVRTKTHLVIYAIAITLCFLPPVRKGLVRLSLLLESRGWIATPALFLIVAAFSIWVFYATAIFSARQFTPAFHDEFSYQLQAVMLASGHLSMPAHPLGSFFDTFYVITDRAYASQYFPGAALMMVPGVWMGWDAWVMPLLITGGMCGMLFLVMRELFDGATGLAAVVVSYAVLGIRIQSISMIAQIPALLLGLCAIYCALRWLKSNQVCWVIGSSIAMGWMAITRPVDAIAFAVPIAAICIVRLIRSRATTADITKILLAAILPATPFFAMQLKLNQNVTGNWFETPFGYYAERDMPGTSFGFNRYDESARPMSPLPQKQAFYVKSVLPTIKAHTPTAVARSWLGERGKGVIWELYGDILLLISVPAALICMRDPRRWMVASILFIWCVLYSFYAFRYVHYYVVLVPSAIVLTLSGFESIVMLFPRSAAFIGAFRVLVPATVAVMSMPQFKSDVMDQVFDNPVERDVRQFESTLADARAILLIRGGVASVPEWELVYNIHSAWPDDSRVVRAHDLGDMKNRELFAYYAARQPDRVVYRFDREDGKFTRLGNVAALAETSGEVGDSISTTTRAIDLESAATSGPSTTKPN